MKKFCFPNRKRPKSYDIYTKTEEGRKEGRKAHTGGSYDGKEEELASLLG